MQPKFLVSDWSLNDLGKEPNVMKVQDPVTVVGDLHGQYYDL
jgi:hypothetical protein